MTKRIPVQTMMDDATGSGTVELFVTVERETEKALLCSDGTRQEWIPRSQIRSADEHSEGTMIVVPEWLAIKKGFV